MTAPSMGRRVVVTGMGALTPLGLSVDEFWAASIEGRSGIGHLSLADAGRLPVRIGGEVRGFECRDYVEHKKARRMARFSQLAAVAAVQAVASAASISKPRTGRASA